jgi:hypothetical protein
MVMPRDRISWKPFPTDIIKQSPDFRINIDLMIGIAVGGGFDKNLMEKKGVSNQDFFNKKFFFSSDKPKEEMSFPPACVPGFLAKGGILFRDLWL